MGVGLFCWLRFCRTAPQPRRCFGGSIAANYAPPVLACLPYFTRSPSFRLRWPACPGAPLSPSFRAGRPPPPPVGSPSLPLLTLPGHRFRVGFCLRFATPFSPPFARANFAPCFCWIYSDPVGEAESAENNRFRADKPGGVVRRGQTSLQVTKARGAELSRASPPLAVTMRPPLTAPQLPVDRWRQGSEKTSKPLKIKASDILIEQMYYYII